LSKEKKPARKGLSKAVLAIVAVVVIAGAVILYQFVLRPSPPKMEVAFKDKMAFPLPDEPSIAVLPFTNMSEDPKQEFLCDGMTEEIITALSKVSRLLVISRQSTFSYKSKPVKVKQVSEELGVRYVLEGSFQRSGDRVRITAQLIDALTGNHLWAERYERDLKDIFALQDEITMKILTAVQVKLTDGGEVLSAQKYAEKHYKGKQGLDCYLKVTEAWGYFQRYNIEGNNLSRQIAEEVIAMCPENPMGYHRLGWAYYMDYVYGNTKSPQETLEKSMQLAKKVLVMDDSNASAHGLLAVLYLRKREYDKAIAEGERAMALSPNSAPVFTNYTACLNAVGRAEEAIPLFQKAIRVNPAGPSSLYNAFGDTLRTTGRFEEAVSAYKKAIHLAPDSIPANSGLAATYNYAGRPEEAIPLFEKIIRLNPVVPFGIYSDFGAALRNTGRFDDSVAAYKKAIQLAPDNSFLHVSLAATYIMMGREKEARVEAAEVLRMNPKFSLDSYAKTIPYRDQSQKDRIRNALRKAGLK